MLRRFFVLPACDWMNPRCYAMLCYVLCVFVLQQQNGGDVLCVFVLHSKMAAMLSFSPIGAEMAEVHVYLSSFPQCLWGGGGDRCKRSREHPCPPPPRPLSPVPTYPYPSPTRLRRCVSVRMGVWIKYWALDIINDKWSNCGSDDSLCKYWRNNSYHFILIIFLFVSHYQVNCACVGFRGTDAPTTLLEWGE